MLVLIRRYQKYLLAVLAVVVIITFVFWGSASGGNGPLRQRPSPGKIFGKSVSSADFQHTYWGVYLMYYLRTNQRPDDRRAQAQLERETWVRMLLARRVDEMGLYVPEEKAIQFLQQLPAFQKDGRFDQERYQQFLTGMLPNIHVTENDLIDFVRLDLAIDELRDIVCSTVKVTPLEIRQSYEEANQKLAVAIVPFVATNFIAQVKISDKDAQDYFDKNKEAYRIPDRVKVRYLKVGIDQFQPKVTVTDSEIKDLYEKRKAAFTDEKTKQAKPLEAVRAELRDEIAKGRALKMARDLAEQINDEVLPDPRNPEQKRPDLPSVAKQHNLALADTDFFSEKDTLNFVNTPSFQRVALTLSADNPYGLVRAQDADYLLQFVARKPSELPTFAAVRAKVIEDLTRSRALELARKAGREDHDKFKAVLSTPTSGNAPKATLELLAGTVGLKALTPAPFPLEDPPSELPYINQVERACLSLAPGELSDFIETPDGGLLVQLKQRLEPDLKKLTDEEARLRHRLLYGERFFGYGQPGKRDIAFNRWLEIQARQASIEPAQTPNTGRGTEEE